MKIAFFAACFTALPIVAAADSFQMTYENFEEAVPHFDLEACPSDLAAEDTFCRGTINHDGIHVFQFDEDGDRPLIGYKAYSAEKLDSILG